VLPAHQLRSPGPSGWATGSCCSASSPWGVSQRRNSSTSSSEPSGAQPDYGTHPAASQSKVAPANLLLIVYNLLPLPFSDVLTDINHVVQKKFGRQIPQKAYAMVIFGLLGLMAVFVTIMDLRRMFDLM